MQITDAINAGATRTGSAVASNDEGLASDFDTFLQLLTAQIRNQDPLKPAESTEFVAQLATFSNVEQSVQTNDLLKSMASQMSLQNMGQLASWVGMEARAAMPVNFEGQDVKLLMGTPSVADKAELVVTDTQGVEVQRVTIDPDETEFTWNGTKAGGIQLPDGIYQFHIESSAGDQPLENAPVETYGVVTEATQSNGEILLLFGGGVGVPSAFVQGLRAPQS